MDHSKTETEGATTIRSKRIAADLDRGLQKFLAITAKHGGDVDAARTALQAGAMWGLFCVGCALDEDEQREARP